ncbi:MAG: hypothetical protein V3W36_00350 [Acidimicrobiia bacterium]
MPRSVPVLLGIALLLGGCGGGEMSMTDYGERIDAAATEASQRAEELFADAVWTADATPRQLQGLLERGLLEIRIPLQESVEGIDPPAQIADLHDLMWDWHSDFISVEQALVARVGEAEDSVEGWTALSESPQVAAYRSAIAEGKQICDSFQARLDATAAAGAFADTPWIPSEMKEVVEAALGCQWFPEDPENVYRYPLDS